MDLSDLIRKAAEAEEPHDQNLLDEAYQSVVDEKQTLELERALHRLDEIDEKLKRERDIHLLRIRLLGALFLLIVCWLATICVILFLSGRQYDNMEYTFLQLSDPVLIALIGSTTVNVVGLFYLAAKWLYGDKS